MEQATEVQALTQKLQVALCGQNTTAHGCWQQTVNEFKSELAVLPFFGMVKRVFVAVLDEDNAGSRPTWSMVQLLLGAHGPDSVGTVPLIFVDTVQLAEQLHELVTSYAIDKHRPQRHLLGQRQPAAAAAAAAANN
jgi:hypothetical protein